MRERIRARVDEWRLRARLWLDLKVPIPLQPIHIGSAHNFITPMTPALTYKQHFCLLTRTFLKEVCGV